MYAAISAISNYVLGLGGVIAICFGMAGLISIQLGAPTDDMVMAADLGHTDVVKK